jgi:hypothetical protein
MAERTKKNKWLWLLLLLPLLGGLWWRNRKTEVAEERSLPPPPGEIESTTINEPKVAEEPPPPPRFVLAKKPIAPLPSIDQRTAMRPKEDSSLTKMGLAPGDLSDDAIAAFDPDTIAMLNSHKYWTAHGLVDRLYDAWLEKKQQGVDTEDVRQQIACP